MSLIFAVRKDTDEKVLIPEHWLDNPVLGAAFKRYPTVTNKPGHQTKAADTKKEN